MNEKVVEPATTYVAETTTYASAKVEDGKTFAYDATQSAYENVQSLVTKMMVALGSRTDAPVVEEPVAEEVSAV